MKTELSIEIDCPIGRVFEYTCDNVPDWSESVLSDELIESKNDGGAGTTFHIVTEERGKKMEFHGEVLSRVVPTETRILLRGEMFDIDVQYFFADLGGKRTKVTQESEVNPHGWLMKTMFAATGWMMKGMSRRALQKDFETLKRQLEV